MRAIVHFDGDSFFAAVEQVLNYRLQGKPIVTGAERGAPTSVSIEAKRRGLSRGMSMREIKIRCPEAIIVPSNYMAYAIFAQRMYSIVRQYTPRVDEYSIDECFADLTDLGEDWRTYEGIVETIKAELESSLGLTFGVGLATSKTLAKAASKANKPAGFTSVPPEKTHEFLSTVPIHAVWNLGGASGTHLQKLGIVTAADFTEKDDQWLSMHHLGKSYRDAWLELKGQAIKQFGEKRNGVGSLMYTRTFKPSQKRSIIFSQLSKNVEAVCEKARRHQVRAGGLTFYLKTQEFTYHAVSIELTIPTADPGELLRYIEKRFDEVYVSGVLYRATGITIRSLVSEVAQMDDLFGATHAHREREGILQTLDQVNHKYGRHTMFLASSFQALANEKSSKEVKIERKTMHIPLVGVIS